MDWTNAHTSLAFCRPLLAENRRCRMAIAMGRKAKIFARVDVPRHTRTPTIVWCFFGDACQVLGNHGERAYEVKAAEQSDHIIGIHVAGVQLQTDTRRLARRSTRTTMGKKVPPRVRGQIEYFVSPYEQKLFGDMRSAPFMMGQVKRTLNAVKDFGPSLIFFIGVYTWGNAQHEKYGREHRY